MRNCNLKKKFIKKNLIISNTFTIIFQFSEEKQYLKNLSVPDSLFCLSYQCVIYCSLILIIINNIINGTHFICYISIIIKQ